jgi:hypothetical protein
MIRATYYAVSDNLSTAQLILPSALNDHLSWIALADKPSLQLYISTDKRPWRERAINMGLEKELNKLLWSLLPMAPFLQRGVYEQ